MWHQRLGYLSPEALERLMAEKISIKIKGLSTVQYNQCGQAKVKKRVNKAEKCQGQRKAERITMDIHNIKGVYNGSIALLLFTNKYSGLI